MSSLCNPIDGSSKFHADVHIQWSLINITRKSHGNPIRITRIPWKTYENPWKTYENTWKSHEHLRKSQILWKSQIPSHPVGSSRPAGSHVPPLPTEAWRRSVRAGLARHPPEAGDVPPESSSFWRRKCWFCPENMLVLPVLPIFHPKMVGFYATWLKTGKPMMKNGGVPMVKSPENHGILCERSGVLGRFKEVYSARIMQFSHRCPLFVR